MDRICVLDGGDLKEYILAPVAGNVVTKIYAPTDTKRLFLSLRIMLTNDATIANRHISVVLQSITDNAALDVKAQGQAITASQVVPFTITGIGEKAAACTIPDDAGWAAWDTDRLWVTPKIGLVIAIAGGVVGDSYAARGIIKDYPL